MRWGSLLAGRSSRSTGRASRQVGQVGRWGKAGKWEAQSQRGQLRPFREGARPVQHPGGCETGVRVCRGVREWENDVGVCEESSRTGGGFVD